MSEEKPKKNVSTESSKTNTPAIMSAPRDRAKAKKAFIVIGALIVSLAVNVILLITSLAKNARLHQYESEIEDYKTITNDLKEQINQLNKF